MTTRGIAVCLMYVLGLRYIDLYAYHNHSIFPLIIGIFLMIAGIIMNVMVWRDQRADN